MRALAALLAVTVLMTAACHHEPLMNAAAKKDVGGTIAGIVTTDDKNVPLAGRKIAAIDVSTGARFDATTGVNGGYTIQVPKGRYRLELELRAAESVLKQPDPVRITNSDLDPHRDFIVGIKR